MKNIHVLNSFIFQTKIIFVWLLAVLPILTVTYTSVRCINRLTHSGKNLTFKYRCTARLSSHASCFVVSLP